MKPAVPASLSHYRNDRVYRSAERLLASTQRRPRNRGWKGIFFAICIGGALVAWLAQPHPQGEATIVSAPPAEGSSQPAGTRFRWSNLLPFTLPEKVASRPAMPIDESARNAVPLGEVAATASTDSADASASAPSPVSTLAKTHSASVASWLVIARSSSGLILRGELRTVIAVLANVEFRLSLVPGALGGTVEGTVHLTAPTRPADAFPVTGNWINRTIVLQEKVGATVSGRKPTEYKFTIELPETEDSAEVTGLWSNGSQGQGRLRLHWTPRL